MSDSFDVIMAAYTAAEGRLAPVRAELLPPLPARRPDAAARRHLDQPPGLPLHQPACERGAAVNDKPALMRPAGWDQQMIGPEVVYGLGLPAAGDPGRLRAG